MYVYSLESSQPKARNKCSTSSRYAGLKGVNAILSFSVTVVYLVMISPIEVCKERLEN